VFHGHLTPLSWRKISASCCWCCFFVSALREAVPQLLKAAVSAAFLLRLNFTELAVSQLRSRIPGGSGQARVETQTIS
jgi:hypothetical protein